MAHIDYDSRALRIDGQRSLLLSGAIHYPRSTPDLWPALMQHSREAGLNAIETPVFWGLHERERGRWDFSERLDLPAFCRLAAEHGLHVILRLGPYVGPWASYGGFPFWLRDLAGMQMRTLNEPFMEATERWLRFLRGLVDPMLAPNGGPVILVHIENDYPAVAPHYGSGGTRYLQWCAQLGESLRFGVPVLLNSGGVLNTWETLVHFSAHESIDDHRQKHPDHPVFWSACHTGWYDTWGHPHHTRTPQDLARSLALFFAHGGTGVTYAPWHGGTHFDRDSMYLRTASADFHAPLDEFGQPTTKFHHLARLHRHLSRFAPALLSDKVPNRSPLSTATTAWTAEGSDLRLAFLVNDDPAKPATVEFDGMCHEIPPASVTLVGNGEPLMNTSRLDPSAHVRRRFAPLNRSLSTLSGWVEPLPNLWPREINTSVILHDAAEQLRITRDRTDYCWYSTSLHVSAREAALGSLVFTAAGDLLYVFADGRLVATTPGPLRENRTLFPPARIPPRGMMRPPPDPDSFAQSFTLRLAPGQHELSVLCVAAGLVGHEAMLGGVNLSEERKGIWGPVLWCDKPIPSPWTVQPGLMGELCSLAGPAGELVKWRADVLRSCREPLRWWRATFATPRGTDPVVLDMEGMNRGLIWLNGILVARYWLIAGDRPDATPSLRGRVNAEPSPEPTQRYYHLPRQWMKENNSLVIFEENGGDPSRLRLALSSAIAP